MKDKAPLLFEPVQDATVKLVKAKWWKQPVSMKLVKTVAITLFWTVCICLLLYSCAEDNKHQYELYHGKNEMLVSEDQWRAEGCWTFKSACPSSSNYRTSDICELPTSKQKPFVRNDVVVRPYATCAAK